MCAHGWQQVHIIFYPIFPKNWTRTHACIFVKKKLARFLIALAYDRPMDGYIYCTRHMSCTTLVFWHLWWPMDDGSLLVTDGSLSGPLLLLNPQFSRVADYDHASKGSNMKARTRAATRRSNALTCSMHICIWIWLHKLALGKLVPIPVYFHILHC